MCAAIKEYLGTRRMIMLCSVVQGHKPHRVPGRDVGPPVDKDIDSFGVAVFDRQVQGGTPILVLEMNGPGKMVQNLADLLEMPGGSSREYPTPV
jgi:hypothetical protein